MKRSGAGTLRSSHIGETVRLQAWVHRRRDHGGVLFLDLRDRSGTVQVVVHPDTAAEVAAAMEEARSISVTAMEEVRLEWVVEIEGEVAPRAPEAVNSKLPTGEVEVVASSGKVLSRCEPLPFSVDGVGEASEETRLRYRYLDLRRSELAGNLKLRHQVVIETMKYFDEEDFLHVETPILTKSTPEGARDYLVPSRVHRGSFFALPQSPQLFKQILMVSGVERYVQICRCFRDEDLRADRQPEFTQIDVEASFVDEEDVLQLIEGLTTRLFPLADIHPEPPFQRLTYDDAMRLYGSDRPDLRTDLEISDLTDALGKSGFRAFSQAVEDGGVIRALAVPGAADASRRLVDRWSDTAREQGAQGVLPLRRRDGEVQFQVKNVLSDEELQAAAGALDLGDGDLALIVAGPEISSSLALGAVRSDVAHEYDLLDVEAFRFLWVTDFPLVEWSASAGRWTAVHHPFTSPREEDVDLLSEDPGAARSRSYDLILNGVELGGGSIRIHERRLQEKVFSLLGIDEAEAGDRFGFLLDALSYGAPPHGGIALGLDRLVMLMAGADSIREVMAFPKTASAVCLMTEAPSTVDSEKLGELGIRVPPRIGSS